MRIATVRFSGTPRSMVIHETGDAFISETLAATGAWEPYESALLERLIRNSMACGDAVFVDCGANIGWYSVLAAIEGCDVWAFEPLPANAALLRENIRRNGVDDKITLVEAALGEECGRTKLHLSASNQGDHRIHTTESFDATRHRETVEIEVVRLDSILRSRRPAVIKVDTQGSEVAVLRGGESLWKPTPGERDVAIVSEFWPYGLSRCGSSSDEFCELLSPLIDSTHACFELREWDRSLVRLSSAGLLELSRSAGFSLDVRGFTNLAFIPIGALETLDGLAIS